jgi:O-antigen ligase
LASASIFTGSALKNCALVGFVVLSLVVAAFAVGVGFVDISSKSVSMGRVDNDVESLSSRVPLWQQLLDEFASKRLLAGYGYGAFWTPDHLIEVEQAQGWGPGYAHSSYIDLLLSVGAIGTILFIVAMTAAFFRATQLEAWHVASGFGFIAMVIACVLADGALETTFGSTSLMSFFGICAVSYTVLATPISQTGRKMT